MIIESKFRPLWWLKNPHLQTLWPVLTNKKAHSGRLERFTLSDGDFLDLAWFDADGPLVIILHGLEGSIHSPYARAITSTLHQQGYHVLFMHFRGCSDQPNIKDRSYHSGDTADLSEVIQHVQDVTNKEVYAAIGYSLGGNVLLKWLGEQAEKSVIQRAVTVSVPYILSDAALRMTQGGSKIYQNYLLGKLRKSYRQKFSTHPSPLDVDVDQLHNFASFDDQITAPLHGFSSGKAYYQLCSSRQYLKHIHTRTLLIHAKDDPFMFEKTIPTEEDLSKNVTLELAKQGGHVGFIGGTIKPKRWLEGRILEFLRN